MSIRLSEDMYSQEDVQGILDGLRGCMVTNLHQEVSRKAMKLGSMESFSSQGEGIVKTYKRTKFGAQIRAWMLMKS